MVYTTCLWWFGGWCNIVFTGFYQHYVFLMGQKPNFCTQERTISNSKSCLLRCWGRDSLLCHAFRCINATWRVAHSGSRGSRCCNWAQMYPMSKFLILPCCSTQQAGVLLIHPLQFWEEWCILQHGNGKSPHLAPWFSHEDLYDWFGDFPAPYPNDPSIFQELTAFHMCHHRSSFFYETLAKDGGVLTIYEYSLLAKESVKVTGIRKSGMVMDAEYCHMAKRGSKMFNDVQWCSCYPMIIPWSSHTICCCKMGSSPSNGTASSFSARHFCWRPSHSCEWGSRRLFGWTSLFFHLNWTCYPWPMRALFIITLSSTRAVCQQLSLLIHDSCCANRDLWALQTNPSPAILNELMWEENTMNLVNKFF